MIIVDIVSSRSMLDGDKIRLDRTESVLFYFIRKFNGSIGRTKLIKLCYLADFFSRQWSGKPLTQFRYELYQQGPFDSTYYKIIDNLEFIGCLGENESVTYSGYSYNVLMENPKLNLSNDELFLLEEVFKQFGNLQLKDLIKKVYATEPVKRARKFKTQRVELDFSDIDSLIQNKHGWDLKTCIDSLKDIDSGKEIAL